MKKALRSGPMGAVLMAFFLSSCGGSSTEPDPGLDQATAMALAGELMGVIMSLGFGAAEGPESEDGGGPGTPPALPNSQSFSETVPCEGGGSINLAGTTTSSLSEEGTGNVQIQLAYTPNACGISTSQGLFTVNGAPSLSADAAFSVAAWSLAHALMQMSGGFTWTGANGSGSCSMNVNYDFNYTTNQLNMSGSMCGYQLQ